MIAKYIDSKEHIVCGLILLPVILIILCRDFSPAVKSGANKAGINTINLHLALLFMLGGIFKQITVRQIKYLNNIVEQDHRFVKKITKPMRDFKAFYSAKATLAGIELHHMLRKGQHNQSSSQTIFEQFYGLAA